MDRNVGETSLIKHIDINMNQSAGLYKLDSFISDRIVNMFTRT